MRSKFSRSADLKAFCRSYLVTTGLAFFAAGVLMVVRDGANSAAWPWWVYLIMGTFLLGGLALMLLGLLGPEEKMETWADVASRHEASLVLMIVAYPVYLLLKPVNRRRR